MRLGIALAAVAGLTIASATLGSARPFAVERGERAAGSTTRSKPAAPPREAQEGRPRFGKPTPYMASFASRLYNRPYGIGPFVANPLVSSEHRATPEYEYLYTAAPAAFSPPSPSSYRYAADNGYLLRPALGRGTVALAYRWRYCMHHRVAQAPRGGPVQIGAQDAPVIGRERGQKIDNVLNPSNFAGHTRELGSAGANGPKIELADGFPRTGWGSAETHRPCVMVQ